MRMAEEEGSEDIGGAALGFGPRPVLLAPNNTASWIFLPLFLLPNVSNQGPGSEKELREQ